MYDGHNMSEEKECPSIAVEAALVKTSDMPKNAEQVSGYDFNKGIDYHEIFKSFKTSGFQATNFGLAVEEINKMREIEYVGSIAQANAGFEDEIDHHTQVGWQGWRKILDILCDKRMPVTLKGKVYKSIIRPAGLIKCRQQPLEPDQIDTYSTDPFIKRKTNCTIFLGYTSNMSSAGIRDVIRFLVQHKMVDCLVTTAGGVEEDLIKCMAPTLLGDFYLKGSELRDKGINRIGNLLVPNDNYCLFENWIMPILDSMLQEQKSQSLIWSPSKMITKFGEEIDNPESICYWAAKNEIPIFCPALTDGSIGDMIYFHTYKNPGLIVDIAQDIRRINSIAVKATNSGMIIIGGGVVKHHICNSNMMRNGADYSVYINTANEFDGSDSGARPDEAVSWGKIKKTATPVKVYAEATLVFPILVAETFAKWHHHKQ